MYEFKVVLSKLELLRGFWSDTRQLPDGSVQLVKYKEYERNEALKLEKGWAPYGGKERYYIDVELPRQRDLEISVAIIRSSRNVYKVFYTDRDKTDMLVKTGLEELNGYLSKIAQQSLAQCKKQSGQGAHQRSAAR